MWRTSSTSAWARGVRRTGQRATGPSYGCGASRGPVGAWPAARPRQYDEITAHAPTDGKSSHEVLYTSRDAGGGGASRAHFFFSRHSLFHAACTAFRATAAAVSYHFSHLPGRWRQRKGYGCPTAYMIYTIYTGGPCPLAFTVYVTSCYEIHDVTVC